MLRPGIVRRCVLVCLAVSFALCFAAVPARADSIRDSQQWVFNMLDIGPAWQVTEGEGVTVAVVDSGVDGKVLRRVLDALERR